MKHECRFIPKIESLGIAMLVLFFSLSLGPVWAAKPNCNLDPSHPSCEPDGGDVGGTMSAPDIYVWWSGPVEDRYISGGPHDDRVCPAATANAANGVVTYPCHPPESIQEETEVYINLDGLDLVTDGDPPLCRERLTGDGMTLSLNFPYDEEPDPLDNQLTSYFIGMDSTTNDAKCLDAEGYEYSCNISAAMTAFFDHECLSRKKCGRLVLVQGFAEVAPAPYPELNPFTETQTIEITDLIVRFGSIGSNKPEATCQYDTTGKGIFINTVPLQ